jgi:mRNA interferase MazF
LSFDPQSDREQRGRRPALVISNELFNRRVGLAIVCPLTNTDRGFPFHLPVPKGPKLTGFVMVEQVKSIDFAARQVKFVTRAPANFVADVLDLLDACIR